MSNKTDPYPVVCMLMNMLTSYKQHGYEVIDIFTNQADDLEVVISSRNGLRVRATLQVSVKEQHRTGK